MKLLLQAAIIKHKRSNTKTRVPLLNTTKLDDASKLYNLKEPSTCTFLKINRATPKTAYILELKKSTRWSTETTFTEFILQFQCFIISWRINPRDTSSAGSYRTPRTYACTEIDPRRGRAFEAVPEAILVFVVRLIPPIPRDPRPARV